MLFFNSCKKKKKKKNDDVTPLARVSHFREAFKSNRTHHVKIGSESDMKKLSRNLSGKSIAVILGGHAEGELREGCCVVV